MTSLDEWLTPVEVEGPKAHGDRPRARKDALLKERGVVVVSSAVIRVERSHTGRVETWLHCGRADPDWWYMEKEEKGA